MAKVYVFTGGTGFLGSRLSEKILEDGNKIIFIGRSRYNVPFEDRIKSSFRKDYFNLINFVEADLTACNDNEIIEQILKISNQLDGVWHLAADLSFKEKNREKVRDTNINGLNRVLKIVEKFDCPFYYVSTAYVHGNASGTAYERIGLRPKKFNNPYEESKFDAELIIESRTKVKSVIFRPSILIDSEVKTFSNFGYYSFLVSLIKLRKSFRISADDTFFLPIPVLYPKEALLNFMPVNIAVNWMNEITNKPECIGKIFHICNPKPFLVSEIFNQTFAALRVRILAIGVPKWLASIYLSLVGPVSYIFGPIRPVANRLKYFKGYMLEHMHYDITNVVNLLGNDIYQGFIFEKDYIFNIARNFKLNFENKI